MGRASATSPPLARLILYVKNVPKLAQFYQRFFGLQPLPGATPSWLELAGDAPGCTIALHRTSVARKSGAATKLVFGVVDVKAFKRAREKQGLKFGVVHEVDGIEFCNAKDPSGNSISISSRGLKTSV